MEEQKIPDRLGVLLVVLSVCIALILLSTQEIEATLGLEEWLGLLFLFCVIVMGLLLAFALIIKIITVLLTKFSSWFSVEEVEELNLIDTKIAAMKHGLTYKQDAEDQFRIFRYLTLEPRAKPRSNHTLSFSTSTADVQIFDQVYPTSNLEFIGTWIKLKQTHLPNFDILKSEIPSPVYPFDTMAQINVSRGLSWLNDNLKILKPPTQSTEDVESLLLQSQQLAPILNQGDFHALTIRGENLCLYTTGELMTSPEQIVELKERATDLVDIFTLPSNEASDPVDINSLKRSEQDNDADS